MENYYEACMQDMCEMFLFYTGISVFCLEGDTWNQRFFPFYSYTTLILQLQLLLNLHLAWFFLLLLCLVFVAQIIFCVHASLKNRKHTEKNDARNDISLIFMKLILLDRCVPLFAFLLKIIYNYYANCFSSTMFFIYYGSINLLWLFKIVSYLLMEFLHHKNIYHTFTNVKFHRDVVICYTYSTLPTF